MKRVSVSIAGFIFVGWILALLLNIDIYRKTNIELSLFGPITDAVVLMFIALSMYIFIANNNQSKASYEKLINISLFVLGICSIALISFFYVVTFR